MNDPEDLINRISRFVEQQREVYGEFAFKKTKADQPGVTKNASLSEEDKDTTSTTETSREATTQYKAAPSEPVPEEANTKETELSPAERIQNCKTLDELRHLCEQTEVLTTDLEGTNLVFGVGNPNADLMIVGEAPGYNEDRQGEPFVGKAGQLLDKIMGAINFDRSDIYIANILKHRPPNNRNPKAEERQKSLPYLLKQIELVDPKLILCVGKVSGTTLLNRDTTLGSLRKQFHDFHGRELMVTYHPAALLRNQQWKRPTWEDVQMLRKRYDELNGQP
ncbi:MAG: uracil-DNA glycosylase [Balneolaceae bacterium]|nr:uracil-DNA glycosylase [Balneolaceae bacterium]